MAEALIQCGNLIMLPSQLTRLGYDAGERKCYLQQRFARVIFS